MEVRRGAAGLERTSGPPVRTDRSGEAHGLVLLFALLFAWASASLPLRAQDLLILGQSPAGPLLDDGEPASWLDQVPEPAVPGSSTPVLLMPDSADASATPSYESPAMSASGYYASGGLPGDVEVGGGIAGQLGQCPDCGSAVSAGCANCYPGAGFEEGYSGCGTMGLDRIGGGRLMAQFFQPMTQESWLYRPFSAGWFMGFMQGSELADDWVRQEQGFYGGYRLGWDVDPYWGWETRFGFASIALDDSSRAIAAQEAEDLADGLTPDDPYFHRFDTRRDSGVRLWDIDVLWYPYGDTYLRPYFLIGLGTGRVDFMDRLSQRTTKSVLAVPIALGFKYRIREWVALRVEAADNFIAGAGSGFQNLHNFSLTAGLEVRFGGTRTAYWPYYPGRHYW